MLIRNYFIPNRRFTKCMLESCTIPSTRIPRLRLVDFLVRMCRLNDFWKVILPLPVTLKRFLALLLVLTFGIA